jgi:DNA-binding MarR family transcriptional regulator
MMKNPRSAGKAAKAPAKAVSARDLFPLMFEMGRLLKHQFSVDGYGPSSYVQLETLRYVAETGEPDMRDIAQYLRIAAPSATAVADSLVKEGLLARMPDAVDRRRVRLAVSAKGARLLRDTDERRANAFARVVAPLSAKDRAEFGRIMRVIIEKSER